MMWLNRPLCMPLKMRQRKMTICVDGGKTASRSGATRKAMMEAHQKVFVVLELYAIIAKITHSVDLA